MTEVPRAWILRVGQRALQTLAGASLKTKVTLTLAVISIACSHIATFRALRVRFVDAERDFQAALMSLCRGGALPADSHLGQPGMCRAGAAQSLSAKYALISLSHLSVPSLATHGFDLNCQRRV